MALTTQAAHLKTVSILQNLTPLTSEAMCHIRASSLNGRVFGDDERLEQAVGPYGHPLRKCLSILIETCMAKAGKVCDNLVSQFTTQFPC